jgi:hypothetical protein
MIINRHIFGELFRNLRPPISDCKNCGKIPAYQEIEDGGTEAQAKIFAEGLRALDRKLEQNFIALDTMRQYAEREASRYADEEIEMRQKAQIEFAFLKGKASIIASEAKELLESKPAEKTNEYYRDDTAKGEEEIHRLKTYYEGLV